MKIALVTTLPSLIENQRIKEEVLALGYEFELIDFSQFGFYIDDEEVDVDGVDIKADIVIVRGIFNAIKPTSIIINNLRKQGTKVFDNNLVEHKYSIDKISDLLKLALSKIPIPKTFYTRDFSEYFQAASKIGYPVVVKSVRAGKGFAVFKLDSEEALKEFVDNQISEEKEAKSFLMQEFIDYEHDLRCLVIGEDVFTMKRIPGEGEFRANFSLGGSVELFDLSSEDRKLASEALNTVDMSVGGVDILISKDGKHYILEVNHTAGFVGMEKATGKNIAKIWVANAIKNAK